MKFQKSDNALVLSEFGEFLAVLLNRITFCADPNLSPKAAERLFSKPGTDPKLNQDWKEFVEPELRHLFQSANEVVNSDLAAIEQTGKIPEFTLRIPLAHTESWLSSLNQARLALAATHAFTEVDLEEETPPMIVSERDLALLQMHLYQAIQEVLVQCASGEFNGSGGSGGGDEADESQINDDGDE
jgi:hypothetical protein